MCVLLGFSGQLAQADTQARGTLTFAGWGNEIRAGNGASLRFQGWGSASKTPDAVLGFHGFGGPQSQLDANLQFAGWANTSSNAVVALRFSGWANSQITQVPSMGFKGWANDAFNNDVAVTFEGWANSTEQPQTALAFSGFGDPSFGLTATIGFFGWANRSDDLTAAVSFSGCIRDTETVSMPPLAQKIVEEHFASTDTDPNIDLEGNWLIEWEDAPQSSALATLTKGGEWQCIPDGDGCWHGFTRAEDAPWTIDMYLPDTTLFPTVANVGPGRQFNAEYYYGILGHWGGTSTGRAGPNSISGEWSYRELSGRETWTRINSNFTGTIGTDGAMRALGQPVAVISDYDGPANSTRGYRPTATLKVLGDQLWGVQRYWIPNESGIEIERSSYLCSDWQTTGVKYRDHEACFPTGGAVGLEFELIVWDHARPGRHYLYLNDIAIPIDLTLRDFPECDIYLQ